MPMKRWMRFGAIILVAAAVLSLPQGLVVTSQTPDAGADQQLLPSQEAPNGACSPPPQCWRDRDCDRVCGKNNGQCIRINSCYTECACYS
jgi:hypothetical protein